MDLCSVTVAGFRRFRSQSSLRTNGKLVALVGPNEAGKSSLLRAVSLLAHDDPPSSDDFARGEKQESFLIEGKYFLSPEDLQAAGLSSSSWLRVVKRADGVRKYGIEPAPPERDLSARRKLGESIEAARENPKFGPRIEAEGLFVGFDEAMGTLKSDAEDIDPSAIAQVSAFVEALVPHIAERDIAVVKGLPKLLQKFRKVEDALNPRQFACRKLKSRLPEILFFDEQARALASEYDLSTLSSSIPSALDNLCRIADLDIKALLNAHARGDTATVTTLEHRANDELKRRFKQDWQQSGVSVSLRVQNNQLAVQVVNQRYEFTSFAERSDGLRQFVALQAFATGKRAGSPILLIDEAEQRLHYDAQADLVQMLARQQLAAKVIYTTHSAGCLPEDLGNGVRFARARHDDETRSDIANKFWAADEPGFAPLLFGMGASTLAFFPTRHAVMVEGPADMLLLPTMLREALQVNVLGFQFVPGLSSSEDEGMVHARAIGKDSGILYLVDGDVGGTKLKGRLLKRGVSKSDVFELRNKNGSAKEVEDFLDPDLLLEAVNQLLAKYHVRGATLTKQDLPSRDRMSKLEEAYRRNSGSALPKVDLAYEVLDIIAENPGRRVLAPDRRNTLRDIATSMLARFEFHLRSATNV